MGNSHGGVAAINLSQREVSALDDGTLNERWSISYSVEGLTSNLQLIKEIGRDGKVGRVFFKLNDNVIESTWPTCRFTIWIFINQTNLLETRYVTCAGFDSIITDMKTTTIHTRDGVTSTTLHLYGSGNVGGLLVQESKTKNGDEMPYEIAVAHYYTKSSGNNFSKTKTDIGFSVVARVRAFGGNLDITVEGPAQHPASALFYMFEDAFRTGIWKPTACPHCAMNVRQQRGKMSLVSDSEDSDSVPVGSQQNARKLVNKRGAYHGNGSGSFFERNNIYF